MCNAAAAEQIATKFARVFAIDFAVAIPSCFFAIYVCIVCACLIVREFIVAEAEEYFQKSYEIFASCTKNVTAGVFHCVSNYAMTEAAHARRVGLRGDQRRLQSLCDSAAKRLMPLIAAGVLTAVARS